MRVATKEIWNKCVTIRPAYPGPAVLVRIGIALLEYLAKVLSISFVMQYSGYRRNTSKMGELIATEISHSFPWQRDETNLPATPSRKCFPS